MEEIEQEVLDLLQRKTDNTDELTVRFRNAVMLERVKKKTAWHTCGTLR